MVGPAYDCFTNPLGAVRFLFDKAGHSSDSCRGDWGVCDLFSKVVLDDGGLPQVPEINSVPLDAIPANSLVRFRGMVQDMFNIEYYIGAYKEGDTWHTNKYSDVAVLPPCVEASMQIWERRPLYCVPVPGENPWVKKVFATGGLHAPITNMQVGSRMHQKRHREACTPAFDVEDMETDNVEEMSPNEDKRACQGTTYGSSAARPQLQGSFDPNMPLGEKKLVPCLIKVYDGLDADLKLNDIVEFVGVLTFDPELSVHHETAGEYSDGVQAAFMEEDVSAHLPASKVPRVHCILQRKLSSDRLFKAMPEFLPERYSPDVCSNSSFAESRKSLVGRFTEVFGGDSLAAEYLLLHLLSRVHARVEPMAVGKLSLNLMDSSGSLEGTSSLLASRVSQAIAALLPRSHLMPLSLEYLNGKLIAPRKNYSSNRLMTGDLQLADGTHLVLNETALETGQLTEIGLQNVHFLKNLMEWQKVEYDFEFYKMEMPTDVPVLVMSTARSRLFPADVVVPLRQTRESSLNLPDELLSKWQMYLGAARAADHAIDPSMQKVLEEDLVMARQEDRSLGPDVFHRWLTLARLLSVSFGESTLSLERWQMVRELERRLAERLRTC